MKKGTGDTEESGRNKMFITRLLSGIVLVIIVTLMNIIGGPVMGILLIGTSVVGLREFYRAAGISGKGDKIKLPELTAIVGTVVYYSVLLYIYYKSSAAGDAAGLSAVPGKVNGCFTAMLILLFMVLMAEYVFLFPGYDARTMITAFFGFVYVPVMLSFVFITRMLNNGQYLVWLIYIVSWVCDTAAYCVGMLIGKHKLAPILSPKKSIEGALGGVAGSTAVACLYAWILVRTGCVPQTYFRVFILIGAVGSIVSQVGDLTASAFKRNFDIKDYGSIIPGHGGILDRFDSVLFSAPMICLLAELLGGYLN